MVKFSHQNIGLSLTNLKIPTNDLLCYKTFTKGIEDVKIRNIYLGLFLNN